MFAVFLTPLILLAMGGADRVFLFCVYALQLLFEFGPQGPIGLVMVLSLAVLYLRERESREDLETELAADAQKAQQEALQRTALALSATLTAENARLLQWVQRKEARGESVPEAVRTAAHAIGGAIAELNEAAFVTPFQVSEAEARHRAMNPESSWPCPADKPC